LLPKTPKPHELIIKFHEPAVLRLGLKTLRATFPSFT